MVTYSALTLTPGFNFELLSDFLSPKDAILGVPGQLSQWGMWLFILGSWVWAHLGCRDYFFFFKRFYLFIHERHRERGRDIGRGRSRLQLDTGLDPRTLGSWSKPKADTQALSHPGTLISVSESLTRGDTYRVKYASVTHPGGMSGMGWDSGNTTDKINRTEHWVSDVSYTSEDRHSLWERNVLLGNKIFR